MYVRNPCNRSTRRPPRSTRRSVSGFTLVELLIVISILSIMALVAVPAIAPTQPYKLDLAASEYADAIRFARLEAMRNANPYGVEITTSPPRVRVFRDVSGTTPPTPVYDVRHPLTKRFYDLDLGAESLTKGVAVASAATWSGSCSRPERLGFDPAGTPRCGDPWAIVLQTATLTLSYAGHTRRVVVDGETGRVTVQ